VNAFENGWEETDSASRSGTPTSVMDECRVEQVKSVLECTAIATEVRISPVVFTISSLTTEGNTVCAKWIPHVLSDDQRAMYVFLSTKHLQHWRNEDGEFLYCILMVDESWIYSFDPQLK
jgi:hypothetical protein